MNEMGKMKQTWRWIRQKLRWIRQIWRWIQWNLFPSVLFFIVFVVIVYLLVNFFSCDANKRYQIIAVIGALITGIAALSTYSKNSSIKRMEFIDRVYEIFDKNEDIANLHDLLMEDENLKISPKSPNEPALVKALTLFDTILNYYEQNLINDEALSYIAAEVLDFYKHPGVQDYIENIHQRYKKKGYKQDIWPYSGLKELEKLCSKKFFIKKSKSH
jgi:hypothetical protein